LSTLVEFKTNFNANVNQQAGTLLSVFADPHNPATFQNSQASSLSLIESLPLNDELAAHVSESEMRLDQQQSLSYQSFNSEQPDSSESWEPSSQVALNYQESDRNENSTIQPEKRHKIKFIGGLEFQSGESDWKTTAIKGKDRADMYAGRCNDENCKRMNGVNHGHYWLRVKDCKEYKKRFMIFDNPTKAQLPKKRKDGDPIRKWLKKFFLPRSQGRSLPYIHCSKTDPYSLEECNLLFAQRTQYVSHLKDVHNLNFES
jgi:hypothetical protein